MVTPLKANMFHSGSTCPFCQEAITERQQIIICPDCGCVQHDLCWGHNNGCASYHCDNKVTTTQPNFIPELTITSEELDEIIIPSRDKTKKPEQVAKEYLSPKPKKRSLLALISLITSLFSLISIAGLFSQQIIFFVISIGIAILAASMGVIALVGINLNSKKGGGVTAAISICFSSMMMIFCFFLLKVFSTQKAMERTVDLQLSNTLSEEQLNSLPLGKLNALKANTVIRCVSSGLFGEMTYGSGVITKIENNRAFILTNKHVIGVVGSETDSKQTISVILYNGETSLGNVEWLAPDDIDIAIISCEILAIKFQKMIKVISNTIAPSTQVFAVGNPMNFFWSYTEGVISSLRIKTMLPYQIKVYQTQTPINSGNSGGGLYSMEGALIGINTWTLNKSFAEGLNFSISSQSIIELLGNKAKDYLTIDEGGE